MNEVGDSFRLAKVHSAVQECPLRKLPRLCKPATKSTEGIENPSGDVKTPVAADFYRVLSGVRGWSAENGSDHIIKWFAGL
jgi:hypothetical protein